MENKPEKKLVNVDVLEHLEITNIDEFLISEKSVTHHFCFLVIDLRQRFKYFQTVGIHTY